MGTKHAVEHLLQAYNWDYMTRAVTIAPGPGSITVHEFDYKGLNKVVYEQEGVTIRSFPAIHSIDGPVSYSLEWNGLKFVFGSDTYPNKWFDQYARNADLAIHECFIAVPDLVFKMRFSPEQALQVGTQIHTAPEAFGKVMSAVKPRMAIAYHFINDFDTAPNIQDRIRSTYDGPLTLAEDMLVWNVTKDDIRVREVVYNENVWTAPIVAMGEIDMSLRESESDFIISGVADFSDIIDMIYARTNEKYGTSIEPEVTD